jgi:hypothetical protein
MKKNIFVCFLLILPLTICCCEKTNFIAGLDENRGLISKITRYGSYNSFDLATWNIEHFPKDKRYTAYYLSRIIKAMDLDLIALQEIEDIDIFFTLIDSLEGYTGIVSRLPRYGQKLALIYKDDFISMITPFQIFTDDNWHFPRPPLVTYVMVKNQHQIVYNFTLIVIHLKAFSDETSIRRRRGACQML